MGEARQTGRTVVPMKSSPLKSWKVTSPTSRSKLLGFVNPTIPSNRFVSSRSRNSSIARKTKLTGDSEKDSIWCASRNVDRSNDGGIACQTFETDQTSRNRESDIRELYLTCERRRALSGAVT